MKKLLVVGVFLNAALLGRVGVSADCDFDGVEDAEEILAGTSADCNSNGVPDDCDVQPGLKFREPVAFLAGEDSLGNASVAVATDFNGDSVLDLVTTKPDDSGSSSIFVLLGKGDGGFEEAQSFAAGRSAQRPVSGDFDGNGFQDIALINHIALNNHGEVRGDVAVLLGRGDGTFQEPLQVGLPWSVDWALEAAHLDGDENVDLAVVIRPRSCPGTGVAVLHGRGNGTFEEPYVLADLTENPACGDTVDFGVADVDGDEVPDLVTNSAVFLNDTEGGFGPAKPLAVRDQFRVLAADFDSDGRVDLIHLHLCQAPGCPDDLSFSRGNGDGTFQSPEALPNPRSTENITAGDLDADGNLDLILPPGFSDQFSWLQGNGDGSFGPPLEFLAGIQVRGLVAADLDKDGLLDVATVGANGFAVLLNRSGAVSTDRNQSGIPDECAPSFLRGDCDGDGTACSGVNDALTLLGWLFRGDTRPECVAACDPDGNGELELADAVYGLNFCFAGTDAPVTPFPACGVGTETGSALGCEASNCQ